jgi:hypothetical protein
VIPARKNLLSRGLALGVLLLLVYLVSSGRLHVTQGGLVGALLSFSFSAVENGLWKKLRNPVASAVVAGLWFSVLAYMVRFGSFRVPLFWLLGVALGTCVVVAITEAKAGRGSPQMTCLLWAMSAFVAAMTELTQTNDPTPFGPALFWSLFFAAIIGIVRMFTLLPTGSMIKQESDGGV